MALVAALTSLYNEKLAVIMKKKWGLLSSAILKNMEKLAPLPGRGETFCVQWEDGRKFTLVDSSYNANPVSIIAEIDNLEQRYKNCRKIIVIGDMKELGTISPSEHLKIFKKLSNCSIDKVYAVGSLVVNGFNTLPSPKRGGIAHSQGELLGALRNEICDSDVILLKGSHSINLGELVQNLRFSKKNAIFCKKTA
jgi:UDP-N-acetylmuramyl pentapeptide synthase